MELTPESMILSGAVYGGLGVASAIKYLIKKKGARIKALILGSGAGKSHLAKTFNELYKDEKYYFLDIDNLVMRDAKLPPQIKEELTRMKTEDPILYTARVTKFYRALMVDLLPTLKKMNKTIVVLLSNRNFAKFLGIKERIYLTSDRKLFQEQRKVSEFKEYIDYCRSTMKASKCELFRDYDDLLVKVQQLFGITDKL